jgi:MFS transporter, OFA family, oxalate/formate antiporter
MANLVRLLPDRSGLASGLLTTGGRWRHGWGPLGVWLIGQAGLAATLRIFGVAFFVAVNVCSRLLGTAPHGYAPAGWAPPPGRVAAGRRT